MSTQDLKARVESIDVFRGLTIFVMMFVIAVAAAGYKNLPQQGRWFGGQPVSTWYHAEAGWEDLVEAKKASGLSEEQINLLPEARLKNIGCTITDLVAPFFVFIVGLCIPLSGARRGSDWWRHVLSRTGGLILAGVLYISLILGLSWWWGILQAIGVAYFMGAASMKLSLRGRWAAVFGVLAFHIFMSHYTSWWLHFGATDQPFWTVGRIYGSWAKPLIIHCRPWVSISYGAMTMIGVLLGSALVTRERAAITRQCLLLGGVFGSLGYLLHAYGLSSGHIGLCFNKPDVTASYAMFASGVGALVFLGLYYLVDIMGVKRWASPLKVFGANALLAYFMQIVMRLFFRALQIEPLFAGEPNQTVKDWASLFTSPRWSALFLDKSGYHGVFWGLLWTFCLWLIIRQCNKRGLYWKL